MDENTPPVNPAEVNSQAASQQQYYASQQGAAPQQQYYAQQQAYAPQQYPNYAQAAPVAPVINKLTGGVKAAWFFIGFLLGIPGILIAFATNWDKPKPIKSESIKFSAIGLACEIALIIIFSILMGIFVAMIASSAVNVINNLAY